MFIVSRKSEESVIVDGFNSPERALKVTVMEVKGGRVKLSFEVNSEAPVSRSVSRERVRGGFGPHRPTAGSDMFSA